MTNALQSQVALVTGAAGGIGRAICERFLAEGARVALLDVPGSTIADATAELDPTGESAFALLADVSVEEEVQQAVAAAKDRFGSVDILINNAAIPGMGAFLETEMDRFDRVMEVNVRGSFLMARACAGEMVRKRRGSIVQLASTFAYSAGALRHFSVYNMSKAAVRQMVPSLAGELAPHNVRVNAVAPGTIDTAFARQCMLNEKSVEMTLRRIPLRRFGQPNDIASVCAFLCSDDARYITGQTVVADGGFLIG